MNCCSLVMYWTGVPEHRARNERPNALAVAASRGAERT
jgi:hypothetical protein